MPPPFLSKIISCPLQANPATSVQFDAFQNLIETRPLGQPAQLACEVLLQRLAALLSPALQRSMHILGNIPHQHIWHAYIMLSLGSACKPESQNRLGETQRPAEIGCSR
jgi:hypothetical protein